MQHSTAITPASFRFTYQGTWSPNRIYSLNDVVRYKGRTWYCQVVNSQQYFGHRRRPDKDTEMWQMNMHHHVIRGGWSPHFTYHLGDVVSYASDWYMCQVSDAKEGSHPIYKNGTTTTEWRKMTASARKSPRLYVPHWSGWNPMGWTKYGSVNNCGSFSNYQTQTKGMTLLNHCGDLVHFGKATDYHGAGAGSYHNRKAMVSNIHRINNNSVNYLWGHTKSGLYNEHPRIVQWGGTNNGQFFLTDDGQVYGTGASTDSYNGLNATASARRLYMTLGKSDTSGQWLASATALTGTMADDFIVKLAFGGTPDTTGGAMMALDSDGDVWVWGEASGGLGTGNEVDVTLPTKVSADLFGGVNIVDIFAQANISNLGSPVFWLIDANGMLWQLGGDSADQTNTFDNQSRFRHPFPIGDFGRYGGIKEFYPSTGMYGGSCVLCHDGTFLYAGDIYSMWGNRDIDAGPNRHTEYYMPLSEYYFRAMQVSNGRFSGVGTGFDIFENVEKAFPVGKYLECSFVLKHKETGEFFNWGYGGYYASIDNRRSGGGGQDGQMDVSSRYEAINQTNSATVVRMDIMDAGTHMEEDIVHFGFHDESDATTLRSVHYANALYSNGRIKAIGPEAAMAGFANGDVLAAEVGYTANWRPGELMSGWDDTAGQAFEVRGGTNSQNNIMSMGITSNQVRTSDQTHYPAFMRMEGNGKVWVTGHGWHRNIEQADQYQYTINSVVQNEDADLFGWFCVS